MAKSRRRAPGEGSVFQRKDGYWVTQIELGDGKRKQYYLKTQREAVEKLRKAQRELEQCACDRATTDCTAVPGILARRGA